MFSIPTPSIYQSPKCYFTHGTMRYPDPQQLPSKGKPWSSLLAQDFVHKVDIIIPQDVAQTVKASLEKAALLEPVYYRVIMTLGQILDGVFFTEYIKLGNIMMLSDGRLDADDVFSLKGGTLSMYLGKETYERAGLVGKPYGTKGKRGLKPRWIVQYDLRQPAMAHGKKGFDRLISACNEVFAKPTTWLFCNLSKVPEADPLQKHFPVKYTSSPGLVEDLETSIPILKAPESIMDNFNRLEVDEYTVDIYEWLSLIRLGSPRVAVGDNVDRYISTYAPPGSSEDLRQDSLCKLSWEGFIPSSWTQRVLAELALLVPSKQWFSLSATSFAAGTVGEVTECTIMRPPKSAGEYLLWDIHGHS